MNCPKCKSENVNFQAVAEKQKVGCMAFLLFGMFNALRPTKTKTYAVCQNCGHRWESYPFVNRLANKRSENNCEKPQPVISQPPTAIEMQKSESNVFFYRPSNSYGKDYKMKIFVNGTELLALENGATKDIQLSKGEYDVIIKMFGSKPSRHHLIIEGDAPILFDCRHRGGKFCVIVGEK